MPANNAYKYEDREMLVLLEHKLGALNPRPAVPTFVLPPMDNIIGDQLRVFLDDEKTRQGRTVPRKVLVPYNLGGGHWVGIAISIGGDGRIASAEYMDPLGNGIPAGINDVLQGVYGGANLAEVRRQRQGDLTSCGPITIENLLLAAQDAVAVDTQLTALQTTALREGHIGIMANYDDTFYNRQLNNISTVASVAQQLGYLLPQGATGLSLTEVERIANLVEAINSIDSSDIRDKLYIALKQPSTGTQSEHYAAIRQAFTGLLVDPLDPKDQPGMNKVLQVIFGDKTTYQDRQGKDFAGLNLVIGYDEVTNLEPYKQLKADEIIKKVKEQIAENEKKKVALKQSVYENLQEITNNREIDTILKSDQVRLEEILKIITALEALSKEDFSIEKTKNDATGLLIKLSIEVNGLSELKGFCKRCNEDLFRWNYLENVASILNIPSSAGKAAGLLENIVKVDVAKLKTDFTRLKETLDDTISARNEMAALEAAIDKVNSFKIEAETIKSNLDRLGFATQPYIDFDNNDELKKRYASKAEYETHLRQTLTILQKYIAARETERNKKGKDKNTFTITSTTSNKVRPISYLVNGGQPEKLRDNGRLNKGSDSDTVDLAVAIEKLTGAYQYLDAEKEYHTKTVTELGTLRASFLAQPSVIAREKAKGGKKAPVIDAETRYNSIRQLSVDINDRLVLQSIINILDMQITKPYTSEKGMVVLDNLARISELEKAFTGVARQLIGEKNLWTGVRSLIYHAIDNKNQYTAYQKIVNDPDTIEKVLGDFALRRAELANLVDFLDKKSSTPPNFDNTSANVAEVDKTLRTAKEITSGKEFQLDERLDYINLAIEAVEKLVTNNEVIKLKDLTYDKIFQGVQLPQDEHHEKSLLALYIKNIGQIFVALHSPNDQVKDPSPSELEERGILKDDFVKFKKFASSNMLLLCNYMREIRGELNHCSSSIPTEDLAMATAVMVTAGKDEMQALGHSLKSKPAPLSQSTSAFFNHASSKLGGQRFFKVLKDLYDKSVDKSTTPPPFRPYGTN